MLTYLFTAILFHHTTCQSLSPGKLKINRDHVTLLFMVKRSHYVTVTMLKR